MQAINLYALCSKSNNFVSSFVTGYDDNKALEFFYNQFLATYNELADDKKELFLSHCDDTRVVKIGCIDHITHDMKNDFNVLGDMTIIRNEVNNNV